MISWTLFGIFAWISDYRYVTQWGVFTQPYSNFNDCRNSREQVNLNFRYHWDFLICGRALAVNHLPTAGSYCRMDNLLFEYRLSKIAVLLMNWCSVSKYFRRWLIIRVDNSCIQDAMFLSIGWLIINHIGHDVFIGVMLISNFDK